MVVLGIARVAVRVLSINLAMGNGKLDIDDDEALIQGANGLRIVTPHFLLFCPQLNYLLATRRASLASKATGPRQALQSSEAGRGTLVLGVGVDASLRKGIADKGLEFHAGVPNESTFPFLDGWKLMSLICLVIELYALLLVGHLLVLVLVVRSWMWMLLGVPSKEFCECVASKNKKREDFDTPCD